MIQTFFDYWHTINWEVTAKATRDFTVSVASVVGVIIAYIGLTTWRRQLRGNTEYELARRLMKAALKVREAIRIVRNPSMSPGEMHEAVREAHPDKPREELKDIDPDIPTYNARWRNISDAMLELKLECTEAEVIWGEEVKTKIKPLQECVVDLRIALEQHLQKDRQLVPEKAERVDKIVYEMSSDPDKDSFTKKVHEAIEEIHGFLSPHLSLRQLGRKQPSR